MTVPAVIPDHPDWLDHKGRINEVMFADHYLSRHPMKCIGGRLFTVDGLVEDENALRREIYGMICADVTTGLAKRTTQLLEAIKLACHAAPLPVQTDRIHVANGTYFLDGHFEPVKEFCHNRLPAAYLPETGRPVNGYGFWMICWKRKTFQPCRSSSVMRCCPSPKRRRC